MVFMSLVKVFEVYMDVDLDFLEELLLVVWVVVSKVVVLVIGDMSISEMVVEIV